MDCAAKRFAAKPRIRLVGLLGSKPMSSTVVPMQEPADFVTGQALLKHAQQAGLWALRQPVVALHVQVLHRGHGMQVLAPPALCHGRR